MDRAGASGFDQRLVGELFQLLGWDASDEADASCLLILLGDERNSVSLTHLDRRLAEQWPGLPVALFEPRREIRATGPGASSREVMTELTIKEGFARLSEGWVIPRLAGWYLARPGARLSLYETNGNLWVCGVPQSDPRWSAVARERGEVLVLYGTELGVARPTDLSGPYGLPERRMEFDRARKDGRVAAAVIAWRDEQD